MRNSLTSSRNMKKKKKLKGQEGSAKQGEIQENTWMAPTMSLELHCLSSLTQRKA